MVINYEKVLRGIGMNDQPEAKNAVAAIRVSSVRQGFRAILRKLKENKLNGSPKHITFV